jgi:hypothetical protein
MIPPDRSAVVAYQPWLKGESEEFSVINAIHESFEKVLLRIAVGVVEETDGEHVHEQYAGRAAECGQQVDTLRNGEERNRKHAGHLGNQHVERRSRRMRDAKGVRGSDELARIPEARARLHGAGVEDEAHHEG